ncbi:MAG TPA: ABC transporter permease [Thermoanaerobaculia bacterium]|nr:ABC transporter permease [Thermoanaerobaculia bacterium]
MTAYAFRRAGGALLLVFLVVSLTFFLLHAAPGSPADYLLVQTSAVGQAEARARLERALGLDRPLGEQYLDWLGGFARGDLGTSFATGRPVARMLAEALPQTLLLAVAAVFLEILLAVPLAVWAARRRGRAPDQALRVGALVLYSLPVFWLSLMAILLFAFRWPLFPAGHLASPGAAEMAAGERLADLLWHLALPAAVLALASVGGTLRYVRASLGEALDQDYVRTARAKGLSERRVVYVHGLRNALGPVLQVFGVSLPALLNGSLIVEVLFSWPGVGRIAFDAINARDFPVVLGATALSAVLVVLGNLAADLLHAAADPRLSRV